MDFAAAKAEVEAAFKIPAVAEALGDSASKVKEALFTMNSEFTDKVDHVGNVIKESMGRKSKLAERDTEIVTLKDQVEELTGKADTSKLDDEIKVLREFHKTTMATNQKAFAADFANVVDHANFETAKQFLTLPAQDADGKLIKAEDGSFDFGKATPEQMAANVTKLSEFNALNYFSTEEGDSNENRGDNTQRQNQNGKSHIEAVQGAKTRTELEAAVESNES